MKLKHAVLLCSLLTLGAIVYAQNSANPAKKSEMTKEALKVLLVTGEGYHDYEAQKTILKEGIESRLKGSEVTVWHHKTPEACKEALSKEGWADPYDVVFYNICHAKETDGSFIKSIVDVHRAGKPGLAMHCSLHSFHWKTAENEKDWLDFLGVTSPNHGAKGAITVTQQENSTGILDGHPESWKTPDGELYNIDAVKDSVTVLAMGDNHGATYAKGKKKGVVQDPQPVIWVNQCGDGKVFGTSLGHHNETVGSDEFLNMIVEGIKWAVKE